MRISYKWFLPVLILVFCCDNTKQQNNITNDFTASKQLITIEDINALGVVEQPLDLVVKDSIFSSWKAYHQILTQTDFIKKADLAFFESDLKSISKSLYLQGEFLEMYKRWQDHDGFSKSSIRQHFSCFLDKHQPSDIESPSLQPGKYFSIRKMP